MTERKTNMGKEERHLLLLGIEYKYILNDKRLHEDILVSSINLNIFKAKVI